MPSIRQSSITLSLAAAVGVAGFLLGRWTDTTTPRSRPTAPEATNDLAHSLRNRTAIPSLGFDTRRPDLPEAPPFEEVLAATREAAAAA